MKCENCEIEHNGEYGSNPIGASIFNFFYIQYRPKRQ